MSSKNKSYEYFHYGGPKYPQFFMVLRALGDAQIASQGFQF
jgi:hypothetical protein